jgi:hypothetical protein
MKLLSRFRIALKAFSAESRRDDGVIGLVIVLALLAAAGALIATTVRQNKDADIRRLSANATTVKLLKNSIVSFYLTDPGSGINGRIPCPDTDFPPDGSENGTTTCTANTGVVPWLSLGLSENDVIDAYGNFYTYAVSGSSTSRSVCASVANSYNTSIVEYTGTLNDVTDTEVRLSSQSASQGAPYYYAFVSHGKNGLGAISATGTRRSAPTVASEVQNCPSQNSNCTDPSSLTLISGPKDETNSTYFDDIVFLGSNSQLTELCESLTPGGKAGADVSEEFTQTSVGSLPARLAAATGTASVQQSTVTGNTADRVLRFTGANAAVRTASTSLNTAERARYISFEWRPTTLGTNNTAGISVGLRATVGDRGASTTVGAFTADLFNANTLDGITVRFFEDTADNANGSTLNRIYICNQAATTCATGDAAVLASSGSDTFTITTTSNPAYAVEVYDDGVQIWARITQVGTAANTATVSLTSIAPAQQDLGNSNGIVAVNYSDATVELDDVLVGRGTMGVSFDGSNDHITAGDNFDTTTGNLTLEAWIRPDTLPTGSNQQVLISKWTQGGTNSAQGYRLYLTAGGALAMDVAGDDSAGGTTYVTETAAFGGYNAAVGRWDHIAVTYSASEQAYKFYYNRDLITRRASTAFGTNGINQTATATFAVGAELNSSSAVVNAFDGDIADVRVWSSARTAQEVFANYNRRIQLTSGLSGLLVNWTLDRDTTLNTGDTLPTFGTTAAVETAAVTSATNGTLTDGASYIGIQQRFVPAFASATICAAGGAQGAVVSAFQCDYRLTTQTGTISVPSNLPSVFVRAWGGGGGGYDFGSFESAGGGGGFSAAKVFRIGTLSAAGQTLNVDIGGGATASADDNDGAGGGGASGVWLDSMTDSAVVVAGGGGGAAYGDDNFNADRANYSCNLAGECGPGGGGGGPQNVLSGVAGAQATDAGAGADVTTNICGGRGGGGTYGDYPPDPSAGGGGTHTCDNGGADPTTTAGASGGGTNTGGTSTIGASGSAGGAGYDGGPNRIGAGGGGGGVSNSAITSGGAEAGGYDVAAGFDNGSDTNQSGFGGGGGAGFADTSTDNTGFIGAAGAAPAAGGATDPAYAGSIERVVSGSFVTTAYCASSGTPCTNTPGRGGEPNVNAAGRPGAVVIKW